jgi:predicted ArsR family transcriptional regulator
MPTSPRAAAIAAIAHPVRLRVLQHLTETDAASIPDLAQAAGVHENTVRAHISALEEAGLLVSESRAPAGPGRPGIQYRLTPEGDRVDQEFMGMGELLAAVVSRAGVDREQLHEVGKDWGRYLVGRPGTHPIEERIPDVLNRLGFQAAVVDGEVRLTGCPCPLLAADDPYMICALASGVIDGVLLACGADRSLGSEHHDPAARNCTIELVQVPGRLRQLR